VADFVPTHSGWILFFHYPFVLQLLSIYNKKVDS